MNTLTVNIPQEKEKSYPIIIGKDLLDDISAAIKNHTKAQKFLIITNPTVYALYGEKVKNSLLKNNFVYEILILQDGEKHKNITNLEQIWTKSIECRLERKDCILALGGGVIGDIAGFAASTYLRGIDFIQVPTTLLAQVDSSVGGKVAINHPLGKNLIGAFYQPKLVYTDISTLSSLPVEQLKVGLAEVLKYGFIETSCNLKDQNHDFTSFLEENRENIFSYNPETLAQVIEYSCKLKAAVVNQDEKEAGLRAILNFGHTIGHAVEKCSKYEMYNHGEAVAIGMKGAFYIAYDMELIDQAYLNSSLSLIEQYGLDLKIPKSIEIQHLLDAMLLDKKVLSKKIRFILPIDKARVDIFSEVNENTLISALQKLY